MRELFHKHILPAWHRFTATSAPAGSSMRGSSLEWTRRPRRSNSGVQACLGTTSTATSAFPAPLAPRERKARHRLNGRLVSRDTLVVVAIDCIGRRWPETIRSICDLRDRRGVKVRSMVQAEAQWTGYLEADGKP